MDIDVQGLTLKYGEATAIDNLDLSVADGEALVLLGQSGCGKTSTMRCIAGLEEPSAGTIRIGGEAVFDSARGVSKPPHKRNIGMVFQSYAIWPHLSVFENVAFPLVMEGVKKPEIARRVTDTLELVGLAHLAERGASLLSGGQMQRVALARSLVMQPSVLLLDEPLSNLDARLRDRLRIELRDLQQRLGLTSIYVTHDQQEALALADKIALMQGGRIVQIGTPDDIYSRPVSASIADFLGVGNILPSSVVDPSTIAVDGLDGRVAVASVPGTSTTDAGLRACVRAEDIVLGPASDSGVNVFTGTVNVVSFQGPTVHYLISAAGGAQIAVLAPKATASHYRVNDTVTFSIAPDVVQVLPQEVIAA
ncbi:iron(III) transport system ATP-binding protein [Homoserinimonas aerilata]|uniref:Iron(III) transport system ATP-binding protein n=1 Tax=Homoserinimonas aerilata TaxID=1162970 RepID=A0A542YA96_9MICO|nr:ABC transporter ATP-binding protein [Homoserinimonas aerilata]TQL45036.1 iron(III) transport system ATP-binding protein [Homoserinimonas aerilata]